LGTDCRRVPRDHPVTATIAVVDYGIALPNFPDGASPEGIEAATEVAERLGWSTVWTTDHVLVPHADSGTYGRIYEAILTLAWVGARHPTVRLGTSVIVVPQRNAVILAKELATIDVLSGGRLICGVGVGWNRTEFGNLGEADRFGRRGAYLDEAIELWRHLWGGGTGPFEGRFHSFGEILFGPLPVQGQELPVWVGGRAERALRRAGRLGNGYHATTTSPAELAVRVPVVLRAAEEAGRPAPLISSRVRVHFGPSESPFYVAAGTPEQMIGELRSFEEVGAQHLAFDFVETDPDRHTSLVERFDREVLAAFR
jgi:probable F420-dependent oxidoreductase